MRRYCILSDGVFYFEPPCRPISVTPILSRLVERCIVRSFIYPALFIQPPSSLCFFSDQYALRPSGSTTAALRRPASYSVRFAGGQQFCTCYSPGFSRAFDSVRHSTVMETKWHSWICRTRCTTGSRFLVGTDIVPREVSSFLDVTASIILGSGLGPASYTVNAADLRPRHAENAIVKYADDTYLIINGAYT